MLSVDLENINWFWIIVGSLAAWRLTNVVHWEGIAKPIRGFFGGKSDEEGNIHYEPLKFFKWQITFFGKLLSCFWCLSVWIAFGVTIMILVFPWILIPFAVSTIAIIIEERYNL